MQRIFVVSSFVLTLSWAFIDRNNTIARIADNEANYVNATNFQLASINPGELDIIATTYIKSNTNTSANSWSLVYRTLLDKTDTFLNFTAPDTVSFSYGYVFSITTDNDTGTNNIPQVTVYQTPVSGGAALARITLSTNTFSNYIPKPIATGQIGGNVYVFYLVNNTNASIPQSQVNVTSFTIGGGRGSLEYNLTTAFAGNLTVTWGEALGRSQLYANWIEGTDEKTLKFSIIDVSKGIVDAISAVSWSNTSSCQAFSTDKKWYGDLCTDTNTTAGTLKYYIRFNSSAFLPFNDKRTLFTNTSALAGVYPYSSYIVVLYCDTVSNPSFHTFLYEIWNLSSLTSITFPPRSFLATQVPTPIFRVDSDDLYSIDYKINPFPNATLNHYSSIFIGRVLSGSYLLNSVLYSIITIIAGVLLSEKSV